jgi:hypothetical protein
MLSGRERAFVCVCFCAPPSHIYNICSARTQKDAVLIENSISSFFFINGNRWKWRLYDKWGAKRRNNNAAMWKFRPDFVLFAARLPQSALLFAANPPSIPKPRSQKL